MTTLREAAQQALEFLEAEFGWSPGEAPRIDALRAALAQQDEPVLVQGELPPRYVARSPIQAEPLNLSDPAVQKRLAAQWGYVPAAQAEPVEPVAWTVTFHGVVTEKFQDKEEAKNFYRAMQANYPQDATHRKLIPLYTAPPQRKLVPLTEEKKRALADKFLSCQPESYEVSGVFDLISAVERAHGIKE